MELVFVIIILLLLIPTAYAALIGAPLAITRSSSIDKIIKVADLKDGENFFELGTGTGKVLVAIAKNKKVKITGFELSPIFYLLTILNIKLNGIKNYIIYGKNFFNANLGDADVIFCFLTPDTMEKLKDKFLLELKEGTRIISYAFEIKGWSPYHVIKDDKNPTVYFYKI